MFDSLPVTATVDRRGLVETLDFVENAVTALEAANGDPDLIAGLRDTISHLALEIEASDLIGAVETAADPVAALQEQLDATDHRHLDEREHHYAGLSHYGAATPVTCHHCGVPLRARWIGNGWVHPRTDCPYVRNPHPADRRADLDLTLRVAPDHRPSVRRRGQELVITLASPAYLTSGIRVAVAIPQTAARRWALNLFSEFHHLLAEAEAEEQDATAVS